jgi:hypothetical protein
MSLLLNWARQQSWWNVAESLLSQDGIGVIMHVPEVLPEGLSKLSNKRTGSFVKFHTCNSSKFHILLAADVSVVDMVLEAMEKLPAGEAHHHDPTQPSFGRGRGFGIDTPGEA